MDSPRLLILSDVSEYVVLEHWWIAFPMELVTWWFSLPYESSLT